jgi:hypothetical protein
MNELTVKSHTQIIEVKSPEQTVTVISAGPPGPAGIQGPTGPTGPQGPAGVHVGTTPPADTSILWYDTN